MKRERWVAGLLAGVLVAGMTTQALAKTVAGEVYTEAQIGDLFQQYGVSDVAPKAWFAGSMTVLLQAGLLQPDQDGKLNPEATLSAGTGVSIFAKVLGIAAKTDTPEEALEKAKAAGLVDADVTVDRDMTRMEVARLLATALGVKPAPVLTRAQYPFNDYDAVSAEDRAILLALYNLGIFKGYEDRTFRPGNILTRAEIAILVDRVLSAK